MAGYDPQLCIQKLNGTGLTPACEVLTNPALYHCNDLQQISPVVHQFCADVQQYYAPVQALLCINHDNAGNPIAWQYFPPKTLAKSCAALGGNWYVDNCYCCCSCFAYDTKVAVPGGTEPIQFIPVGAKVLTATVGAGGGAPKLAWSPTEVTFSAGVAGGDNPFMVYIAHDDSDLICTPDQVFMLADGKLTTAAKLVPGDQLVDQDGKPVQIHTVSIGDFKGGVHHIGTTGKFSGDINGHLILAGGVVSGDYLLQVSFDGVDDALKADDHDDRPEIGSDDYQKANSGVKAATAQVVFSTRSDGAQPNQLQLHSGKFKFYRQGGMSLGSHLAALLTDDQSTSLLENTQQLPLSNTVPKSEISNIFAIMRGFYPGYVFYLDWYRMEPNVYAVEQYGEKIVVVTGGLARTIGLSYEGLAMAVAHGLARFMGLPPRNPDGFIGAGAADYYAFGIISRSIWFGNNWVKPTMAAFNQLDKVLSLIAAGPAAGDPNDPIEHPSIECRLEAMQSGFAAGALPTCCGGPQPALIGVEQAQAEPDGVALTLSIAPTSDTAVNSANYTFNPAATIKAVKIDPVKDFIIHVAADLKAGTAYTVTIANLMTLVGDGVDPAHASAPVAP